MKFAIYTFCHEYFEVEKKINIAVSFYVWLYTYLNAKFILTFCRALLCGFCEFLLVIAKKEIV